MGNDGDDVDRFQFTVLKFHFKQLLIYILVNNTLTSLKITEMEGEKRFFTSFRTLQNQCKHERK